MRRRPRGRTRSGGQQTEVLRQCARGEVGVTGRRAAGEDVSLGARQPPSAPRPSASTTASRGKPTASPRAKARRSEPSESPSTPLATSFRAAASVELPKTSVSPSRPSTSSAPGPGLPPASTVSRPAATAGVEPITGACRYSAPRSTTSASSSAASSGATVAVLTTVMPADKASAQARAPRGRRAVVQAEQHHVGPATTSAGASPALRVQVRTSCVARRGQPGGDGGAHPAEAEHGGLSGVVMSSTVRGNRHATSASHACSPTTSVMMVACP